MSQPRNNPKRDANEPAIVRALQDAGYLVERSSELADLVVQRKGDPPGCVYLLECKGERGRFTPKQIEDRAAGWVIPVVRTIEEALEAVSTDAA